MMSCVSPGLPAVARETIRFLKAKESCRVRRRPYRQ